MIKFSQKAKYFMTGAVAMAVIIPLTVKAVDTIPLTFNEGDLISANLINTLLQRINDSQRGFVSSDDVLGIWSCTTYTVRDDCTADFTRTSGGTLFMKTQNITFSKSGSTYTATATFNPGNCTSTGPSTATSNYEAMGTKFSSYGGIQEIQRLSPEKFVWGIGSGISGGGVNAYAMCVKQNTAPSPINNLDVAGSGTTAALTWTDQSTDETGFKVQRRLMSEDTFTTVTTAAANATSFSDTGLASGTYVYRVLATNGNGDSISSSEVSISIGTSNITPN